ncbi:hypothetical protein FSP39_001966 [Pinctada imbricata]|uniref:Uncharacterized protein n=1 Tax=Pinctada imbricata TaxID=66713 RepID=A0AA88XYJ9_PINIB|nr:hypothetical protein FSP39_001966 [Pinctada imbricata]
MLLSYIKVGEKPKDQEKLRVFEKLTAFLSNIKDAEAGLQTKGEKQISENDWMARVAVHLLSKLLLGEDYRLDSCCRKKLTKCPCPCKATLKYGVTSIGNPRTYYGNLDVIIGTFRGAVAACEVREAEDEDEDVTTSDASNEEQKDNPALTFVPTVGVSKTHIQFHFYDSQKDIYLLSCEMPLFDIPMEEEQQLNLTTILAIWLVMNYSYLMTGSTSEMEQDEQFGFHTSCKPTILHRYKNDITHGSIDI